MNIKIIACQIIGPAAAGSAGPVPTPLEKLSCPDDVDMSFLINEIKAWFIHTPEWNGNFM